MTYFELYYYALLSINIIILTSGWIRKFYTPQMAFVSSACAKLIHTRGSDKFSLYAKMRLQLHAFTLFGFIFHSVTSSEPESVRTCRSHSVRRAR